MSLIYKEYALDEATVEEISARVQDYLNAQKMERRSVQRIRLTAEELLLNILSHCGRGVPVSIGLGKQYGRQMLRLRYEGDTFDPVKSSENALSDEILRSLGALPAWSYRGRMNTVSMTLAERPSAAPFSISFWRSPPPSCWASPDGCSRRPCARA